jgi:hypothetical protein
MGQRPTQNAGGRRPGGGTKARARPNQVRTVVSEAGTGKNIRSMRAEIEIGGRPVKSATSGPRAAPLTGIAAPSGQVSSQTPRKFPALPVGSPRNWPVGPPSLECASRISLGFRGWLESLSRWRARQAVLRSPCRLGDRRPRPEFVRDGGGDCPRCGRNIRPVAGRLSARAPPSIADRRTRGKSKRRLPLNADVLTTSVTDGIAVVTLGAAKRIYFDEEMVTGSPRRWKDLPAIPTSGSSSSRGAHPVISFATFPSLLSCAAQSPCAPLPPRMVTT